MFRFSPSSQPEKSKNNVMRPLPTAFSGYKAGKNHYQMRITVDARNAHLMNWKGTHGRLPPRATYGGQSNGRTRVSPTWRRWNEDKRRGTLIGVSQSFILSILFLIENMNAMSFHLPWPPQTLIPTCSSRKAPCLTIRLPTARSMRK